MTKDQALDTVAATTDELRRVQADVGDITDAASPAADAERLRLALNACVLAKRAALRNGCTMRDFIRIGA